MRKMIRSLTSKLISGTLSLRLLSIVLAIFLWSLVINTEDPVETRTFSNVEVEIVHSDVISDLNQAYQVKNGETISFSIRGKKSIVDKMRKSDFEVTADLAEMSSVNAVPIRIVAKRYANNIEIVFGNDRTLTLEIEDMQQIQVPVVAETTGEPADGYTVGTKTTNPNLISIKGPVSIVNDLKQVKVTVDITGAKEDIVTEVEPVCCDSDGNQVKSGRITLDASKIRVNVQIWKTKKIDLIVRTTGTPADGYTIGTIDYEPQYIYVAGENKDLKEISELELPVVDVSDKRAAVERTVDLTNISLPEGINLAQSDTSVMIKVNIDQTGEKDLTITPDDISIENNDSDYGVEFLNDEVELVLSGLKTAVANTTVSDLNPQIDLSGLEPGEHTVTLQLNEINNVEVSGSRRIRVLLTDGTEEE